MGTAMSDKGWTVGDVPRPLIEVLDPATGERLALANMPELTLIDPDGNVSTPTVVHDADVINAFDAPFELTQVGEWVGIVESPAPRKDVQSFTLYANPPA
jgi:hypothetical protein